MLFGHGSRISGYLVPALMWMVQLLPERSVYEMLSVSLTTWTGVYWEELYRENTRLPRLVYVETGRFRVNTHIHFYISGYAWQHYRMIWQTAENTWREQIDGARDCVVQDNLGADRVHAGYCWKEFDGFSAETLLTKCCYLPTHIELH